MNSEQDLRHAAELRDEIHSKALARVRAVYPAAELVIDPHPVEDYFQEVWDYPGRWYTVVAIPEGYGSRKALVEAIVRETLEHYRNGGAAPSDEGFYQLIAAYTDAICEYCIITAADRLADAASVFPYQGSESHRKALGCACRKHASDGVEWPYDLTRAKSKKISSKALFAPANSEERLNYRGAFLGYPHKNSYTDMDFDRVNSVLFPGGEDALEVRRWTTDWCNYFNDDRGWQGTLCLTVYDKSLDRFVVIMASATD